MGNIKPSGHLSVGQAGSTAGKRGSPGSFEAGVVPGEEMWTGELCLMGNECGGGNGSAFALGKGLFKQS